MKNYEIYEMLNKLGMLDVDNEKRYCKEGDLNDVELFQKNSSDIIYVTNFVNNLFALHDENTIKQFIISLLIENSKE